LFHSASGFPGKLGFQTARGPQAHGQLPARFNNCGVEEGVQISRWLNELHRKRLAADYDLTSKEFITQFNVAVWIAQAEQAIVKLNTLTASQQLCHQIRKGIREYDEKLNA
jgi:hypothetical protein